MNSLEQFDDVMDLIRQAQCFIDPRAAWATLSTGYDELAPDTGTTQSGARGTSVAGFQYAHTSAC